MLHLHRSERADVLVAMLGDVLAVPLADPLAAEVVAVPTRGIERWLTQQLSRRLGSRPDREDGACGNVDMPFPGTLVGRTVAEATGVAPDADPWSPDRSVWHLLDILDAHGGEPWLSGLAAHLGGGGQVRGNQSAGHQGASGTRRFAAVRHVADLFDRYGVHRPEMLLRWASGADDLPPEDRWQAGLWRLLRERVAVPSPPERTAAACAALRAPGAAAGGGAGTGAAAELPERLAVFGVTRLPASYLEVLDALAAQRDVHLFLLHPSPAVWARLGGTGAVPLGAEGRPSLRRRDHDVPEAARHPLLRSWGRDALEMQVVLAASLGPHEDHHRPVAAVAALDGAVLDGAVLDGAVPDGAVPDGAAPDGPAPTLLARLQADVRADRRPPGPPALGAADMRLPLDAGDDSIRVHACHGRARQVEVLRDAVLHLFADHPDLEPRDVVVMCPDIETYAPLIHATFGTSATGGEDEDEAAVRNPVGGGEQGAPVGELRVRLADRSLRQTNPLLGVVAQLLDLAATRVTASQVLDLAGKDPVRRRFGLGHDDLARLAEWVGAAGIRWGLDAAHRAPFKLDGLAANSWRAGLDRALLGVAMADEGQRQFGGAVPLDDMDSGDIDLVGRLAELVERLGTALRSLAGPQRVDDWAEVLVAAAEDLTATSDEDAWQAAQVRRLLEEVVEQATVAGAVVATPLTLADMTVLLADRLRGRPTRANFRTGHLTICTLVPMRSVPHRVVCLLGLDDGAFPRHPERDGDDLVGRDPCVGDRDARSEDRQLLLDALLAAHDHLVVTYTGRDERTNLPRPPAVPLGELIDVVDRTAVGPGGSRARDLVVVHHPLQPFDPRCFRPGALTRGGPWSFDGVHLEGARALQGPRRGTPPFLAAPLDGKETAVIEVGDLERFVRHPARAFLRLRLGIALGYQQKDLDDALPVELDGLSAWDVGERMLGARLGGASLDACVAAERARGHLPPGALADDVLAEVTAGVEELVSTAGTWAAPASLDVNLVLPSGATLVGTVAGVRGDVLQRVTYSRLAPVQRLVAWLQLLALTASRPERPFEALTIGRPPDGASRRAAVSSSRLPALTGGGPSDRFDAPRGAQTVSAAAGAPASAESRRAAAVAHLEAIVDLFRRGMREPLPLFCKTSAAWATALRQPEGDARGAAARAWRGDRFGGEDRDPEHRLVFGGVLPFESLLDEAPCHDEEGPGWAADETTRLGRLARRLWDPLLAHETMATSGRESP